MKWISTTTALPEYTLEVLFKRNDQVRLATYDAFEKKFHLKDGTFYDHTDKDVWWMPISNQTQS